MEPFLHFWTDFKDFGVVLKISASSCAYSFQNEDSINGMNPRSPFEVHYFSMRLTSEEILK
jgi:hypothetical protein